ncbi:MAG TPA: ferrochelatase [Terriglobales bacterium]|nr:ferrochelatase [Terriglobales bacterium]
MVRHSKRVGVVLFQLGGPDSLAAVEPFLFNLFCDPDIIDFPFSRIGRRPLAKLISSTRAKKAGQHYAAIGGGSPIRKFTEQQALALESRLREDGVDARCVVAMRYWHPFTAEAIAKLEEAQVDHIVLLPLYPQYSNTTTGSSLNEWRRRWTGTAPVWCVEPFYRNPLYIASFVDRINDALLGFPHPEKVELVFSAHSVPVAVIEKGDPYQRQIAETVELVMEDGGWPNSHRVCYQSKVGASRWLQPSLHTTLRTLVAEKLRDVCVVPISFVSDHVETLGEIDHCARKEAEELGIERFAMTKGLNDSPKFIQALAACVIDAIGESGAISGENGEDRVGDRAMFSMAAD